MTRIAAGAADPLRAVSPAIRAQLLYRQAQMAAADRLWQMSFGQAEGDAGDRPTTAVRAAAPAAEADLAAMIVAADRARRSWDREAMVNGRSADPAPTVAMVPSAWDPPERPPGDDAESPRAVAAGSGRGAAYRPMLMAAAARSGLPAAALAAIIDAEAARDGGGNWLSSSRNPRSSAAGLGQFLSATWRGEAERAGTWLNASARQRGWIDEGGHVRPEARSSLLALRYDARASIEAVADYARTNIAKMRDAGVAVDPGGDGLARTAYVAHHLGLGDAIRFAVQGLDSHRAARLLAAQVGAGNAARRIDAAGSAAAAHRDWLIAFVSTRVRPARFSALLS